MPGWANRQRLRALASRDVTGQAKGIRMCRENLTAFAAFNLLTRASQSLNMKLVTVARRVVDDHEAALTRPNTPPSPQGSRGRQHCLRNQNACRRVGDFGRWP
ncbi:MAG TPA: ANTAR domain-containing protein [Mycobacterium sp.]